MIEGRAPVDTAWRAACLQRSLNSYHAGRTLPSCTTLKMLQVPVSTAG